MITDIKDTMLYRHLCLLLLCLLIAGPASAQNTQYVSDKIFIVLHKGPGTEFRWKARLTPGTRLTVSSYSDDGEWAQVNTARGTDGWVRKEYLTSETPAQLQLPQAQEKAEKLQTRNQEINGELEALKAEKVELLNHINSTGSELGSVSDELTQLKQISGKAVQLDTDNRRLVVESENLRSNVEMLEAENLRLQDKLESEDFLNGALAVLLGVIITLVVPRLWPKRRKSSSWA
jgi:SH3 domain protein